MTLGPLSRTERTLTRKGHPNEEAQYTCAPSFFPEVLFEKKKKGGRGGPGRAVQRGSFVAWAVAAESNSPAGLAMAPPRREAFGGSCHNYIGP